MTTKISHLLQVVVLTEVELVLNPKQVACGKADDMQVLNNQHIVIVSAYQCTAKNG